jgi:multidrug efflux system membrane fusion protein
MQLTRGHYLAIGATVIITIWMLTGVLSDSGLDDTQAPVEKETSSIFSVQVEQFNATTITPELTLHGQTAPNREVHLKSEVSGTVLKLHAREGDFVKKGQVLIEIDAKDKHQQLKQAEALLKQRVVEHQANQSLIGKGLQNKTKLAQSESQLAAAQAQVTVTGIALNATKIKAPFSGILEDRKVEVGSYLKVADPVISLLDYNPFIIKGHTAEKDLPLIQAGNRATGKTIDGRLTPGTIRYVASKANAATRTFTVELEINNPSERQADGVTADIIIPLKETNGIFISPALLSLNDKGILGAKFVASDNQVMFAPVELIKAEATGIWVSGLPNPVNLIVVGQSFVSPGEKVNPVFKKEILSEEELSNSASTIQDSDTVIVNQLKTEAN